MHVSISEFSVEFYWPKCLFFYHDHTLFDYWSYTEGLNIGQSNSSTLFFFFKTGFSCSKICTFQNTFQSILGCVYKSNAHVLIRIVNLQVNMRKIDIFTIFQSMNTVCHSVYLGLLSSAICSFEHMYPVCILLSLYLDMSFLWSNFK